jgi:hypothetical protein
LNHFEQALAEMRGRDVECVDEDKCFVHGLGLAVYSAAATYMAENAHLILDDQEPDSETEIVSELPAEAAQ